MKFEINGTIAKGETSLGAPVPFFLSSEYGSTSAPAPSTPPPPPPAPAPGSSYNLGDLLASENATFTASEAMTVRYVSIDDADLGIDKDVAAGEAVTCANTTFGGDPHELHAKVCKFWGPPSSTGGGTPVTAGDIVDETGAIVNSAYDTMYANGLANNDTYWAWRFGAQASDTGGGTAFFERAHTTFPADFGGQSQCKYEHGGPPEPGGGGYFSTSQADAACVQATSGSGTVALQTSGYTSNVGMVSPQAQWQRNFNKEHPNLPTYRTAGVLPASGDIKPIYVISSNDVSSENGTSRIMITANGKLVTVGSNTAGNTPCSLSLPADMLPTCGAMTSKAEVAIVPVWDKIARKGRFAVILCAGLADGVKWDSFTGAADAIWDANGLVKEDWWNEWREPYPGMPNQGNTSFMKLLGMVEIPGMAAPTSCAVTTGIHPWQLLGGVQSPQGGSGISYVKSPIKNYYTEMRDGGPFGGRVARGGLLMIGSKSERKVAFFDLKALFEWIYDSYLGNNHTRGERQNLGMGDSQWPQVLSVSGVQIPHIKTVTFSAPIGALRFTATNPSPIGGGKAARAWICTTDGVAHILSCGDYVPSAATGKQGTPAQIAEVGSISGLGPVSSMATMLGMKRTGNVDTNTGFWYVSRTTRTIGYVRMNSTLTGGSIGFQYIPHASQCLDPVSLADIDNYSNETNAQLVCDYAGKKLSTFRTDILYHNGSWSAWPQSTPVIPTNGVPVEFYGSLATAGKPVHALTANVP